MFDLQYIKRNSLLQNTNNPLDMRVDMYVAYEDIVLNPYMSYKDKVDEFNRRKVILQRVLKEKYIGDYPCALRQHKTNLERIDDVLREMPTLHFFFKYGEKLVQKTHSEIDDKYARRILDEVRHISS